MDTWDKEKRKEYNRKWQQANKEKQAAYYKEYRSGKGRLNVWLNDIRLRAKRDGLEFDLNIEDMVIPPLCPVLGTPISKVRIGNNDPAGASIDRIDSTKGYTKDNVWIISYRANRIKNDSTLAELKLLVTALEQRGLK